TKTASPAWPSTSACPSCETMTSDTSTRSTRRMSTTGTRTSVALSVDMDGAAASHLRLPAVPLKFKGGRNFQREGVTWPIVPRVNHPDGDPSEYPGGSSTAETATSPTPFQVIGRSVYIRRMRLLDSQCYWNWIS